MLNCTLIKTVRQSVSRLCLLLLAISAIMLAAPAAHACMSNAKAMQVYNQSVETATSQYTAMQDQALLQLNIDRAQAKADFDTAMAQPGDDHSSDHYNEAITSLNRSNAQAEAVYSATVIGAQNQCQMDYDAAARSYRQNKCL